MAWLVDFHSHYFSRPFFDALAAQSPLQGEPEEIFLRALVDTPIELPDPDPERHLNRWLAELDRYKVSHLVTFASAPEEAGTVARAVDQAGGRLSGFAVHDPTRPEAGERARALLGEDGFRGLLFFPALHGYDPRSPEVRETWEALDELSGIAVVHCGLLSIPLRRRFRLNDRFDSALANPLHLVAPSYDHPGVRFVVPHFGAGMFHETLLLGAQSPHVFVDTSSSNSWIHNQPVPLRLVDVFERTLNVFGAERILFGTDSSIFPRGWRADLLTAQREALGACGAESTHRAAIFGGNAARLLELQ